ncbi:MAG TPA: hypothetical protein VML95_04935 [Longimicrobiales bacterium]|jgi:hypothetical protein|nr:hypothetical protein [Longimicrobiales bacterium]
MTREDFESYMIRMGFDYEEVEDGLWLIEPGNGAPSVVVNYSPPVALLRLKVMHLPDDRSDNDLAPLYRRLLEFNATDIVHGSYGIEEGDVILSDALELETLDFEELRNSYESMVFAASSHTPVLAGLTVTSDSEEEA